MTNSSPATGSASESSSPASDGPNSSDEFRAPVDVGARPAKRSSRRTAKKPKKPKIRTYIRRRTEIEELTDEMTRLKKQMECYAQRNEVLKQREALIESEKLNQNMRLALHSQRLSFASTLSMVTQFFRYNSTEPFDLPARLSRDPFAREAELLKMKNVRLDT